MALTPTERALVRRALGYLNVTEASVLSFGVPLTGELLFLVEKRMDQLIEPHGVALVREELEHVETTRRQIFEAQKHLAAKKVGNIETNVEGEIPALYQQLKFWAGQLAEVLGVPMHLFSWVGSSGSGVNVPVRA